MCRDSISEGFFHTLGKRHTLRLSGDGGERLLSLKSERAPSPCTGAAVT
jgi:hypothetical protein